MTAVMRPADERLSVLDAGSAKIEIGKIGRAPQRDDKVRPVHRLEAVDGRHVYAHEARHFLDALDLRALADVDALSRWPQPAESLS